MLVTHCCASTFEGTHDVADDEDPHDRLAADRAEVADVAEPVEQHRDVRVDGRAEKDGRDDDQEVLDHEVDDEVGVDFAREGAADIAGSVKSKYSAARRAF